MTGTGMTDAAEMPVEAVLRGELAQGDVVLGTIGPILGHLLANQDHSLFSDEIVARVRGMAGHVARQLLHVEGEAAGLDDPYQFAAEGMDALANALVASLPFLTHCHALSLEWQLARRLEERSGIDPVLSPLLQALIASDDATTAATAMAALAAQARFMQQQRRMELSLGELPPELFHHAVTAWRSRAGEGEVAAQAEVRLRMAYDEGAGRIGLLARLVSGMGNGVRAALAISHAGTALFVSALASASEQDRDLVAVSTNESQLARLAISLRRAGLPPREVEEQFLCIHPEIALPEGFDQLRVDRAGALLAASPRQSVA
jgi:hypothetical protein